MLRRITSPDQFEKHFSAVVELEHFLQHGGVRAAATNSKHKRRFHDLEPAVPVKNKEDRSPFRGTQITL
jgi:hypothetical protein